LKSAELGLENHSAPPPDWDEWSTIDVVQINQHNNRLPGKTLVEMYRYRNDGSDFDVYGQDHSKYQVQAHRLDEDDCIDYFENEWVEKFEEEYGE